MLQMPRVCQLRVHSRIPYNCVCDDLFRTCLVVTIAYALDNVCKVRRGDECRDARRMSFDCQVFVELPSRCAATVAAHFEGEDSVVRFCRASVLPMHFTFHLVSDRSCGNA